MVSPDRDNADDVAPSVSARRHGHVHRRSRPRKRADEISGPTPGIRCQYLARKLPDLRPRLLAARQRWAARTCPRKARVPGLAFSQRINPDIAPPRLEASVRRLSRLGFTTSTRSLRRRDADERLGRAGMALQALIALIIAPVRRRAQVEKPSNWPTGCLRPSSRLERRASRISFHPDEPRPSLLDDD